MRMRYLPSIGTLLMPLAAAGCMTGQGPQILPTSPPSPSGAREGVVVHKIITSHSRTSSAIRVGETELWTCKHVLTQPVLIVDGLPTGYEILEQGQGAGVEDDWAIISVDRAALAPCSDLSYLNHTAQVFDGQEVWLKGFWSAEPLTHSQATALDISAVAARVESPPAGIKASDDLIYVAARSNEPYHGFSGGALVGLLGDRQILLGMYVEADTYLTLSGFHVRHICRKWPPAEGDAR